MADAPFRERGACAAIVLHGSVTRVGGISGDSRTLTRLSSFSCGNYAPRSTQLLHLQYSYKPWQRTELLIVRQAFLPERQDNSAMARPRHLATHGPRAGSAGATGVSHIVAPPTGLGGP